MKQHFQTNQRMIHAGHGFLLSPVAYKTMLKKIDEILDFEGVVENGELSDISNANDALGTALQGFATFASQNFWPAKTFQFARGFNAYP